MSVLLDAGSFSKGWLGTLGLLAVQGTLLALAAFALTRVGRLRPAWQAAIWLVVTVKLALPWGPAMPWSLSDLIASLSRSTPHTTPLLAMTPVSEVTRIEPTAWPAVGWLVLALVWVAGSSFVLVRAVFAHRATTRAARAAAPASADAQGILAELASAMHVRRARLAFGDEHTGPHVVGVLRPIIVVPPSLLSDRVLLRAALLHELAHLRRMDALARIVQVVAHVVMWWCPTNRFVQRRLDLAREAACDAWALETGEVARPAYARLLVRMARLNAAAAPALAAPHSLDARVAAVLGPPARARMTSLNRIALAGFAVLALGGARSQAAEHGPVVCSYTPQMAEALLVAFPKADLDGDGQLSRDEACDLQAELRRVPEQHSSRRSPEAEAQFDTLLAEPLCCNCSDMDVGDVSELSTCQKIEGVEPPKQ